MFANENTELEALDEKLENMRALHTRIHHEVSREEKFKLMQILKHIPSSSSDEQISSSIHLLSLSLQRHLYQLACSTHEPCPNFKSLQQFRLTKIQLRSRSGTRGSIQVSEVTATSWNYEMLIFANVRVSN